MFTKTEMLTGYMKMLGSSKCYVCYIIIVGDEAYILSYAFSQTKQEYPVKYPSDFLQVQRYLKLQFKEA